MRPIGGPDEPIAVPFVQQRRWLSIIGAAIVLLVLLGPVVYLFIKGILGRQLAIGVAIVGFIIAGGLAWFAGRLTRRERAEL